MNSHSWKRQVSPSWYLGHARSGQVVRPKTSHFTWLLIHKRDAWAKKKDLDSYEAQWLYVEALLKVGLTSSKSLPISIVLQCTGSAQVLR